MRAVIVTGVSSGIGRGIAQVLMGRGLHVFGSIRSPADASRLALEWRTGFTPLLFDVRDDEAIARAAEIVRARLDGERLAGLVNNAGVGYKGPLLHQPWEEIERLITVNLLGPVRVTRAFAPLLGADRTLTGPPGRIINVSSVGGRVPTPFTGAYCASKAAIENLSSCLRAELAHYGVKVIVLAPGVIRSALGANSGDEVPQRFDHTDYGPSYRHMLQRFETWQARAWPPERIGTTVWHALNVRTPRPRYFVGQFPFRVLFALQRMLPDRAFDRLLASSVVRHVQRQCADAQGDRANPEQL